MIVYLVSNDYDKVEPIRFVRLDLASKIFRRRKWFLTYDANRVTDMKDYETKKVIDSLRKWFGTLYDIRTANSIDDLADHRFYVIKGQGGKYFSGSRSIKGRVKPIPQFSRKMSEAIIFQLEKLGAKDTLDSFVLQKYPASIGHIYLNRKNPYNSYKYVITCESKVDKEMFFYEHIEEDFADCAFTKIGENATRLYVEDAISVHEYLCAEHPQYIYSVIPSPPKEINSDGILDYIKEHPYDKRINSGGGTLIDYAERNKHKANPESQE